MYMSEQANSPLDKPNLSNELAVKRTQLAADRTQLAAERTLMGWIRTALSLISFGFTIYKFLQATITDSTVSTLTTQGPKRLGLLLIALGTLSVIFGTIEFFSTTNRLNTPEETKHKKFDFTLVLGGIIGLLGLFLFVTIVLNQEVF